jgi:hypothetical protein
LIVLAAAAVLVIAVGARAAQTIRQLHTPTATPGKRPVPVATNRAGGDLPRTSTRVAGRPCPARQGRSAPARMSSSTAGPPSLATLADRLKARLGSYGAVSIAAVDLTSGRRFEYGARGGMIDASVSKLDVLEALLLHHQDARSPLTGEDEELATAMIEHSDNDAGQALWNELGYAPGIAAANNRLGLRHTVPDPAGYYGLTTSSASDQLALLANLTNRHGPLTTQSRAYALGLLRDVESDQRWGVPAAADPGTSFEVKNGWMPIDDDGRWVVNSDGIITVAGHQVLIAVMTRDDIDEQDGITRVEAISRAVAAALT